MTDSSLLQDFIVETGEHLESTERNLLRLEPQAVDAAVLDDLFRLIHTIKGSSEYLGLERIAGLSHNLETLLDLVRRGERDLTTQVIDLLIDTNDRIAQLVDDLSKHEEERASIDDIVSRLDEATGDMVPVSAEEAAQDTFSGNEGISVEDEFDEELLVIFFDQLKDGLTALCNETRQLFADEPADVILKRYEEQLGMLKSSANYMGFDKLKAVYDKWLETVTQTARQVTEGETVDWEAFARETTGANIDQVKKFFAKVPEVKDFPTFTMLPNGEPDIGFESPGGSDVEAALKGNGRTLAEDLDAALAKAEAADEFRFDDADIDIDTDDHQQGASAEGGGIQPELALFSDEENLPPEMPEKIENPLLQDFIAESREHLKEAEQNLLRLERQPDDEQLLNEIFRSIHTIKGSSEYLGLDRIGGLSHRLEDLLDLLRQGERRLDAKVIDLLIAANDRIAQLTDDLMKHQIEQTDTNDLLQKIESAIQEEAPAPVDETPDAAEPAAKIEIIDEDYDSELFTIFLNQLKTGLAALWEKTQHLQAGEAAADAMAKYIDLLSSLRTSANYMGYDALTRVYEQWSQTADDVAGQLAAGEAVGWDAFAKDVTASNLERVRSFFPNVADLLPADARQAIAQDGTGGAAAEEVAALGDETSQDAGATDELRLDDADIDSDTDESAPETAKSEEEQGEPALFSDDGDIPLQEPEKVDNPLLQDFIVEAREHLENLEQNLLRLERQPEDDESLNEIFRSIHTIKGSSKYLGLVRIGELSHRLENLLDLVRRGERRLDAKVIDLLIAANDRITQLTDDLVQHQIEQTDIDDLLRRTDTAIREDAPALVDEAQDTGEPGAVAETIDEDYDSELFSIFLDQIRAGLAAIWEETRHLLAGQAVGDALAKYIDLLSSLQTSANYMGYDALTQVYQKWSQAAEDTTGKLEEGEAVDWKAFAKNITVSHVEKVKSFFPNVTDLAPADDLLVAVPDDALNLTAEEATAEAADELLFDDVDIDIGADEEAQDATAKSETSQTENTLLQDFIIETREHLENTEQNLLLLEQQPDDEQLLNEIFRSIHTIKGSSEYLGLVNIGELSHRLENLLEMLRRGERRVDTNVIDLLIAANDRITQLTDDLEQHEVEQTDIDDLLKRTDEAIQGDVPTSADAAPDAAEPAVPPVETIDEDYDSELFTIFLNQLKNGFSALWEETRRLRSGEAAGDAMAKYIDLLSSLQTSANYMGYDALTQVYQQWSQAADEVAGKLAAGEAVDWDAFAKGVTASYVERVKSFFPNASDLTPADPLQAIAAELAPQEDRARETWEDTEGDFGLLADFINESREHLDGIESNLLRIEHAPDSVGHLNDIFRLVHTIKGSSEYLGLEHIAELSHRLENLLDMLRNGRIVIDSDLIELLINANDRIGQLVDDLVRDRTEQTEIDDLIGRIDFYSEAAIAEGTGAPVEQSGVAPAAPVPLQPAGGELEQAQIESGEAKPPERKGPGLKEAVYEELYDKELFIIFKKQLDAGLETLTVETGKILEGHDVQAALATCVAALKRLKSSANYMEYDDLKDVFERWISGIEALDQRLADGEQPDLSDWCDSVMHPYIERVNAFFPGPIPVATYYAAEDETPALATLDDTETVLPALVEADKTADIEPLTLDALDEELKQEPFSFPDLSIGLEDESGLLTQLESAFDSKIKETIIDNFDAHSKLEVAQQLLSNDASIETIPPPPSREAQRSERVMEDTRAIESFLFSHKETDVTFDRRTSSTESREVMASEEEGQLRRHPNRRQTDKFRDRLAKQSIRVDSAKIDTLMNQVGELVVTRAGFSQLFVEMTELQVFLKQAQRLEEGELQMVKDLTGRINAATTVLSRITSELQENVMKVRMLPIAQVFSRFPRVVHDLVRSSNKKVNLDIIGEETELDRMVIEQIADPLIHLIRNAVDHGIEAPEDRQRAGKPESGTLRLEAYHEGNNVVIEVSDDGRGIDIERVKAKALEKGFVTNKELRIMSEMQILELIMRPGFSTAAEVTHTSGRGVGMDVVKDSITRLNGTLETLTELKMGTVFRIKIPLTLAIIPALMVRVSNQIYTIPLASVDETLRIHENEISTIEGVEVYYLREATLPLVRVADVFKLQSMPVNAKQMFVVVVNAGNRKVGLIVDQLKGRDEVVIKPLEDYLQEKSGFSGATILGDGSISLIIDVANLVQLAIERHTRQYKAAAI